MLKCGEAGQDWRSGLGQNAVSVQKKTITPIPRLENVVSVPTKLIKPILTGVLELRPGA